MVAAGRRVRPATSVAVLVTRPVGVTFGLGQTEPGAKVDLGGTPLAPTTVPRLLPLILAVATRADRPALRRRLATSVDLALPVVEMVVPPSPRLSRGRVIRPAASPPAPQTEMEGEPDTRVGRGDPS